MIIGSASDDQLSDNSGTEMHLQAGIGNEGPAWSLEVVIDGSQSVEQLGLNLSLGNHERDVDLFTRFEIRHAGIEQFFGNPIRITRHRLTKKPGYKWKSKIDATGVKTKT